MTDGADTGTTVSSRLTGVVMQKGEPMDDTISRQAAIDALAEWHDEAITNRLNNLPSAQPERKKGKWIERNPRNSPDCRLIECSECGNAYIVGQNINYDDWIDGRNFCMKCGADLRGGSNDKNT